MLRYPGGPSVRRCAALALVVIAVIVLSWFLMPATLPEPWDMIGVLVIALIAMGAYLTALLL
ncbi:MAG TPA: hypothetical protein VJL84_01825 [Kiloniellales bacterium]|nr:hypothetical protein [Kiloniellales bacterium]